MAPAEAVAILRLLRPVDPETVREIGDTQRITFEMKSEPTKEEKIALWRLAEVMLGDQALLAMGPEVVRG